jgi:hypothetical protein
MTLRMKRTALVGALAAGTWGTFYGLGRTWGSTLEERTRYLPGDDLVPAPHLMTDHAITIKANADEIWPWLVQMGWHRGGWYTYRWVDRLFFPGNRASADTILPKHQHLEVGDHIPDGPPETDCFFVVELLEPAKMLVLRSWTHLPPQIRKDARNKMEWTWAFYLDQVAEKETRFLFRVRGNLQPAWLAFTYNALIVPADFLMSRSLCLGLRRRVERKRSEEGVRL